MASEQKNYQHSDLTEKIIGVYYDVYNELGFGFIESVYEEAMALALRSQRKRISVHQRKSAANGLAGSNENA